MDVSNCLPIHVCIYAYLYLRMYCTRIYVLTCMYMYIHVVLYTYTHTYFCINPYSLNTCLRRQYIHIYTHINKYTHDHSPSYHYYYHPFFERGWADCCGSGCRHFVKFPWRLFFCFFQIWVRFYFIWGELLISKALIVQAPAKTSGSRKTSSYKKQWCRQQALNPKP